MTSNPIDAALADLQMSSPLPTRRLSYAEYLDWEDDPPERHEFVRGEVYASDRRAREALTEPKLVIEVLSPSPAGHDRGEKFAAYRLLPALEEYGLVDPARKSIEGFRRIANGHWQVVEHGGTEQVVFGSVGVSLDRADLFRDAD